MEVAEDAGGVIRDVLTEFRTSFYTECTLGNARKIPCLRHDFGEEQWKAVAKIYYFWLENCQLFSGSNFSCFLCSIVCLDQVKMTY